MTDKIKTYKKVKKLKFPVIHSSSCILVLCHGVTCVVHNSVQFTHPVAPTIKCGGKREKGLDQENVESEVGIPSADSIDEGIKL